MLEQKHDAECTDLSASHRIDLSGSYAAAAHNIITIITEEREAKATMPATMAIMSDNGFRKDCQNFKEKEDLHVSEATTLTGNLMGGRGAAIEHFSVGNFVLEQQRVPVSLASTLDEALDLVWEQGEQNNFSASCSSSDDSVVHVATFGRAAQEEKEPAGSSSCCREESADDQHTLPFVYGEDDDRKAVYRKELLLDDMGLLTRELARLVRPVENNGGEEVCGDDSSLRSSDEEDDEEEALRFASFDNYCRSEDVELRTEYRRELLKDDFGLFYKELSRLRLEGSDYDICDPSLSDEEDEEEDLSR